MKQKWKKKPMDSSGLFLHPAFLNWLLVLLAADSVYSYCGFVSELFLKALKPCGFLILGMKMGM